MHLHHEMSGSTFTSSNRRSERGTMANRLRLHDFSSGVGAGALPHALIVTLFAAGESGEQALLFARQWQPAVPRAAFVGIELDTMVRRTEIAALRRAAAETAAGRSIQPSQIILLGSGEAGRLAVDLVLRAAILCAGVLGLDISLEEALPRVLPSATMVRLVQHSMDDHPQAARFRVLIEAMQRRHLNVRSMILPHVAQATPAVTRRAGATFLVELVANASRIPAGAGS
jgi:hypothetical protein